MQKILGVLRKACETYNLIEENDKICVGISGGKDSLLLLSALARFQKFSPKKFSLEAVAVDLTGGKNDYTQIQQFCESLQVSLTVVPSNVFEVVFEVRKEKNPCSLCANMRRGILNSTAKSLGCNKVALGHHKDDMLETFLISLFFEGRMSTFKPKSYLSNTDLHVIRPLIFCDEEDIISVSKDLPILHNVCPADKHTERENAKNILKQLNKLYPNCKEKIFNAIIHSERYNLFDKM
ncbi:MAG: tRNA 2-thiocytidine(32) synthetase TtcA [Clostridia bacterium]|nr:tRNA 2-thiocytidine(32) synthetase TtcA [Clostridia bacterium]